MTTSRYILPFTVDPQRTAAFSGYRIEKMPGRAEGCDPNEVRRIVSLRCDVAIDWLYDRGYNTFISGMATGFDLWAACAVLAARKERPGLRLLAFIPYREQQRNYDPLFMRLYYDVLEAADHAFRLSERYTRSCCLDRNLLMLEHSTALVCYYDGQPGGTRHTVAHAIRRGGTIIDLCGKKEALSYNRNTDADLIRQIRAVR